MAASVPYIRLDGPGHPGSAWACPPREALLHLVADADGRNATLFQEGCLLRQWNDPLAALGWMQDHLASQEPSSEARWIGHISYDLGRLLESMPATAKDDLRFPLFSFTFHDAESRPLKDQSVGRFPRRNTPLKTTITRPRYLRAVERIRQYIAAGDVYQVNLSQRFTASLPDHPADIYQRMQERFPALYGGCMVMGDKALLSNSPELFLAVHVRPDGSRRISTRPIKGTRPHKAGMKRELEESIKDQAELAMIVDLERNDLGRICRIGSVRVTQGRTIEEHPTVYHGVATVEGALRDDVDLVDILRATFPGGSITGAPKIRAMEVIEELEPVRRGPYCGAFGYLAADGTIELAMAIRIIIAQDGLAHVPVGGGIVTDSVPREEYEETLTKARAMLTTLGVSNDEVQRLGRI